MLTLTPALVDGLLAHARETHPIEACGILAGPAGSDRPARLIRMVNALSSELGYQFDAIDQLAAYRQMDARGEDPIVLYHSHTGSPAIPSVTDGRFALDLDARYLIVSTADPDRPEIRCWRRTPASLSYGGWTEDQVAVEDPDARRQWPDTAAYLAAPQPHSKA